MRNSKLLAFLLVVLLAMPTLGVLAQDGAMVELPAVDPLFTEGDIVTAGSSTVGPLSQAIIERFEEAGYAGTITLDIIGSGAGLERFCVAGETDIANASRAIKDSEIESCNAIGREPIEFRVGTDALAVSVSAENDFVEELSIEDLQVIFSGGSNITWADVNPDYPAEPILVYSPGTDSGTFDYFVEAVFDELAEAEGKENAEEYILNAGGIQLSEDDNVLVNGVADSPYAVGYFGYAYYIENDDKLRAIPVNGVEPTAESVEASGDEAYPLARPLFIYSDATIMAEKPQVAAFINYYLSNVNEVIEEVGYFPASEEALSNAKQAWCDATQACEE